jgi:hypothetical protein
MENEEDQGASNKRLSRTLNVEGRNQLPITNY